MKTRAVVETYSYRQDAETARSLLEAEDIESFVVSDDGGTQYPGLGFARGVQLLVDSDKLGRARDVLGLAAAASGRKAAVRKPSKKPAKK